MDYTTQQVNDQKVRFENFLKTGNLKKIGARLFFFMNKNNNDGRYNDYMYTLRVLRLVANVEGCMVDPHNMKLSYREILASKALDAYLLSLTTK